MGSYYFQKGVTLLEILITLALISVLAAWAVPSFQNSLRNSAIQTITADFLSTLSFARAEAIRLKQTIIICPSENGTTCTESNSWENGWLIYADKNNSNTLDSPDGEPELLKTFSGSEASAISLRPSTDLGTPIQFDTQGKIVTDLGYFVACSDGKIESAKTIILTRFQPRLGSDSDGDNIPEFEDDFDLKNIEDCSIS